MVGDVLKVFSMKTEREIFKHQKRRFDAQYSKFQKYRLENWRISYLRKIFNELKLNSKISKKDALLDIGIGGSGYTVIEAAKKGCYSVGVDISQKGVKKANIFAKNNLDSKLSELANFCVSKAENLPFNDNTFTKLSSIHVLEHVPDDKPVFDEIARVVKPKGRIFIDVPNTYKRLPFLYQIYGRIDDKIAGHQRHYKSEDIIRKFKKRGFVLENLQYHAHYIKILQNIFCMIFPSMKYNKKSNLWWKFEKIDLKQKKHDNGFSFFVTMKKR